jgi:hypothetical protein
MSDRYFRIQDRKRKLPKESVNSWTGSEAEYMNGVSAFLDLFTASRDLLGRDDVDGLGINYAETIEENGGAPSLSVFRGTVVDDDSGSGVVVAPNRSTEKRFSKKQVLAAWVSAVLKEFPEDREELLDIDESDRWEHLRDSYRLTDFEEDAVTALFRKK